jgi:hypothetical protein
VKVTVPVCAVYVVPEQPELDDALTLPVIVPPLLAHEPSPELSAVKPVTPVLTFSANAVPGSRAIIMIIARIYANDFLKVSFIFCVPLFSYLTVYFQHSPDQVQIGNALITILWEKGK